MRVLLSLLVLFLAAPALAQSSRSVITDLLVWRTDDADTVTVSAPSISGSYSLVLPTSSGSANQAMVVDGSGNLSFTLVNNANVGTSAAIAYSKLNLTGGIVNADVNASAAIAYSKLNLASSITSADVVDGTLVNADVSATAAIARSKLASATANAVVINDGSGVMSSESALAATRGGTGVQNASGTSFTWGSNSITLSTGGTTSVTLPTTGTLVARASTDTLTNKTIDAASNTITNLANASISSSAAIARSKLATGTANQVVINDGSGVLSSEAQLAISRGGTGAATATDAFAALSPLTTKGDLLAYSTLSDRMPVGGDGQLLSADSTQTFGLKWITNTTLSNPMTGAGDMITGGTGGSATRLAAGTSGQVLVSAGAASPAWQLLVNANINSTAAIARSKLATDTAGNVVINDASTGAFSSEAQLAKTRGGTGVSSTATFPTTASNDADFVMKAGAQTISGVKTFSANTIVNGGKLLVGSATDYSLGAGDSGSISSTNSGGYSLVGWSSTSAAGMALNFAHSLSGTAGSHTVVTHGTTLASIIGRGSDGTAFQTSAAITMQIDGTGTISSTSMPGRIALATAPSGATNPTERIVVDSANNITLGAASGNGNYTTVNRLLQLAATSNFSVGALTTIGPTQLTASVVNSSLLNVNNSSGGTFSLTGLVALNDGAVVVINNDNSVIMTVVNESSSAATDIRTRTGATVSVPAGAAIMLVYSHSRWHAI